MLWEDNSTNGFEILLTQRNMKAVEDSDEFEEMSDESDLPQENWIWPLLFLCHINDLSDVSKSSVRLFEYDCLLYRTINTKELQNLEVWDKN